MVNVITRIGCVCHVITRIGCVCLLILKLKVLCYSRINTLLHHGIRLSNRLGMLLLTEEIATDSMADDQNVYVQREISNILWTYIYIYSM